MRRRRTRDRGLPPPTGPRVNDQIRVPRVILVDEEGKRLGEFMTPDAISFAQDRGLDLVEVSPEARPPVCRLGDYGRMKFERDKKRRENKKTSSQVKELKVRPKTDSHDLDVKIRRARRFLERGDKVRVVVWFRGREHAHHDIGAERCRDIARGCEDVGTVENRPVMQGRHMHMLLAPS